MGLDQTSGLTLGPVRSPIQGWSPPSLEQTSVESSGFKIAMDGQKTSPYTHFTWMPLNKSILDLYKKYNEIHEKNYFLFCLKDILPILSFFITSFKLLPIIDLLTSNWSKKSLMASTINSSIWILRFGWNKKTWSDLSKWKWIKSINCGIAAKRTYYWYLKHQFVNLEL